MMSDRLAGVLIAALAIAFFVSARQLPAPFFSDPLGPKTFPIFIASVGFVAALYLVLKPDAEPQWPTLGTLMRLGLSMGVLVLYALGLKPLGFLLPTALGAAAISYLITPRPLFSLITGLGVSVGLFILFKYALALNLYALPRDLMP